MLCCRLMLRILVQGQRGEEKKKNAHRSRCVEEATPGGSLLWTARRRITHPHIDAADAGPERAAEYVTPTIGRRLSAA